MVRTYMQRIVVVGLVAGALAALDPADAQTPMRKPARSSLGPRVVQFANGRMGSQVGNGECWTLVHDALAAVGAKRPGQELPVYEFGRRVSLTNLLPGDILQFEGVKFVSGNGSWQQFGHHTAIVTGRSGNTVNLLHQNVNGRRTVQSGVINLSERQGGTINAFRPQGRS